MDAKEQAAGEARVQDLLITPLEALGLARPSTLTKAQFAVMLRELRQKLAYMTPANLAILRDWVEAHPGGKDKDRFPIGLKILNRARDIQLPDSGPSPLLLKAFAEELGHKALAEDWAPELLRYLRGARVWPGPYTITQIRNEAAGAVRRMADIEMRAGRGDRLSIEDESFRARRSEALQKCREIADQAQRGAAA
ncbi:hypothetical protein EPIB2_366 [Tritonibacter mobilis]|uniref:hypothetical protein n=1 Tax=Tritonibacter mobilis TaxID=379347 RepID=UPI000F70F6A2|nr:hypothetical protein [Tritonibacter mobilis]VCU61289.1 hypothetical protein EPIB2_366 [Tritonibacter mobilis]